MKKLILFIYLSLCVFSLNEEIEETTTYLYKFNLEYLPQYLKLKKYVVVNFVSKDCKPEKCFKKDVNFRKVSLKFTQEEIIFLRIEVESVEEVNNLLDIKIERIPSFMMSVYGWKKIFPAHSTKNLKTWIKEVYTTIPKRINSYDDISDVDKHYFVFYNKEEIDVSDFDVMMLGKLVHPLSLYYGSFGESENENYKNILSQIKESDNSSKLFAVRSHDELVLPLDPNIGMDKLSIYVHENEYPKNCQLDIRTMKYITHFKLPTFIYFDRNPTKSSFYKEYLELANEYQHYLMFCIFDLDQITQEQYSEIRYYGNILAGGIPRKMKKGFMRIVDHGNTLFRYRIKGKLSKTSGEFLISNYLHNNLEPFVASESLGEKNYIRLGNGIRKINKHKFDEILSHIATVHLVYVYDSNTISFEKDLNVLVTLSRALEPNKRFSISIMNHDRNDIDGTIDHPLPYVFLSNKIFQRKPFEEELTFTNLLKFLAQYASWLKLKESFLQELKDDHGINLIDSDL